MKVRVGVVRGRARPSSERLLPARAAPEDNPTKQSNPIHDGFIKIPSLIVSTSFLIRHLAIGSIDRPCCASPLERLHPWHACMHAYGPTSTGEVRAGFFLSSEMTLRAERAEQPTVRRGKRGGGGSTTGGRAKRRRRREEGREARKQQVYMRRGRSRSVRLGFSPKTGERGGGGYEFRVESAGAVGRGLASRQGVEEGAQVGREDRQVGDGKVLVGVDLFARGGRHQRGGGEGGGRQGVRRRRRRPRRLCRRRRQQRQRRRGRGRARHLLAAEPETSSSTPLLGEGSSSDALAVGGLLPQSLPPVDVLDERAEGELQEGERGGREEGRRGDRG